MLFSKFRCKLNISQVWRQCPYFIKCVKVQPLWLPPPAPPYLHLIDRHLSFLVHLLMFLSLVSVIVSAMPVFIVFLKWMSEQKEGTSEVLKESGSLCYWALRNISKENTRQKDIWGFHNQKGKEGAFKLWTSYASEKLIASEEMEQINFYWTQTWALYGSPAKSVPHPTLKLFF